jgi:hypothetical protein
MPTPQNSLLIPTPQNSLLIPTPQNSLSIPRGNNSHITKKVLKKKKKETSLPRKKICQKELGENDNNPRKCKYKGEDFSPRTKTSQVEIGTNENMPCKSRSRKRRLDNSPNINDTPAKEGKKYLICQCYNRWLLFPL